MVAIVSRAEWGARPARSRHIIATPTSELWLHHTAGALDANGNGVWWDDMRSIQNFHMDGRGWSDIAYSFVVGGGQIFEGRGVGVAGGHTKGRNTVSHAICLIGNYETMVPTAEDLAAIAALIRHGRGAGWWGELTGPHRAAPGASTSCCGNNLIARIPDLRRMAANEEEDMTPDQAKQLAAIHKRLTGEWGDRLYAQIYEDGGFLKTTWQRVSRIERRDLAKIVRDAIEAAGTSTGGASADEIAEKVVDELAARLDG